MVPSSLPRHHRVVPCPSGGNDDVVALCNRRVGQCYRRGRPLVYNHFAVCLAGQNAVVRHGDDEGVVIPPVVAFHSHLACATTVPCAWQGKTPLFGMVMTRRCRYLRCGIVKHRCSARLHDDEARFAKVVATSLF